MYDEATRREMAARLKLVLAELSRESDRGSVIVGMAIIEDELGRVLGRFLLPSPSTSQGSDESLGQQGHLGTQSAKIDLAYRVGLIRREFRQSLHLCRRLRNDFAHVPQELSFETRSVRDRVSEIFRLNEPVLQAVCETTAKSELLASLPLDLRAEAAGIKDVRSLEHLLGTRWVFELTIAGMVAGLVAMSHELEPIQPLTDN